MVEVEAGGEPGLGYTYGDRSVADFVDSQLRPVVTGADALAPAAAWTAMQRAIRNAGRPGVGAMAISAVDIALWDLKARLLGVCLADALPRFHAAAPVYGSGGFTSYSASSCASSSRAGWRRTSAGSRSRSAGSPPRTPSAWRSAAR